MENFVESEIVAVGKSTSRSFETLSEERKAIFVKYLKYDIRMVSNHKAHNELWNLMVKELNFKAIGYNKDVWLRLLKSWMNDVKSNMFSSTADQISDNKLRQMLLDEAALARPTASQLSCILDHVEMTGQDLPSTWKTISIELGTKIEKKSENYWMKIYNNAKERVVIKAELLEAMRRSGMDVTDEFKLTENDNRLLGNLHHKNLFDRVKVEDEDECRICLERGNDFINLFRGQLEPPSIIDKLLECSRITQVSEADGFPQNICQNCLSHLEIAFQFRMLSEDSERKLRSRTLDVAIDKISTMQKQDEIEKCEYDLGVADDVNNFEIDDENYEHEIELETDRRDTNCESWNPKFDQEYEKRDENLIVHKCETCGLTFDNAKLLKKHIRCHVVAPITSHECKVCTKIFKSEALLRSHGKTHNDFRPFICETCGKGSKTFNQLSRHCLTHLDLKNFLCPHCSYRGSTINNLRIHLRTHTRVKPYSCSICQFKFSTASNMQKHIRNIHQKMRTHQCNQCEKSFFAKEHLRKHLVAHSGMRLYSCPVCSASYAWYNGLKKHMKKQHAGEKCPSEITFRPTKTMCMM